MKNSPLHQKHLDLQAKMADFGGWLMPIEYPGAGVLAEHSAVRERVGLFDVSHLGKASVKGEGALEFLNSMFTNDLTRIVDSKAQYTLLCNPDGGVIDDLIAYRISDSDFFLIPNASNTTDVVRVLSESAPASITVTNLHEKFAVLALQGPRAVDVVKSLGINPTMDYMAFAHVTIAGCDVILCRTGYTGEHGYELVPSWEDACVVWDALVAAMQPFDGAICGLGARDTLRTEMGYPLHGHELSLEISPVQASAGWAIGWKKENFRGSQVLQSQREEGVVRTMKALKSNDRGIPRAGMAIKDSEGTEIGIVTSGTFSPSLKVGIALALMDPAYAIGDVVTIDVRGRQSSATISALPFMPSRVR
ncbi:aminomethyltransferase [Candidatus Planktophila dulcis]|uniref:glycine cleavage system aminomethyltransferase GcvT n=1 Tax=Candidatus Planktophila dulcis TaxID=1884914 RepID=UPI000BAC57E3|nr:glycine cleavage system aminomethyltransferase GcvT [Candidatus Planktophila dulcis]ASY14691.1 aminomethyltransferase [Candidatus Planktophila dulcis]